MKYIEKFRAKDESTIYKLTLNKAEFQILFDVLRHYDKSVPKTISTIQFKGRVRGMIKVLGNIKNNDNDVAE